jgi:hypothetical protein
MSSYYEIAKRDVSNYMELKRALLLLQLEKHKQLVFASADLDLQLQKLKEGHNKATHTLFTILNRNIELLGRMKEYIVFVKIYHVQITSSDDLKKLESIYWNSLKEFSNKTDGMFRLGASESPYHSLSETIEKTELVVDSWLDACQKRQTEHLAKVKKEQDELMTKIYKLDQDKRQEFRNDVELINQKLLLLNKYVDMYEGVCKLENVFLTTKDVLDFDRKNFHQQFMADYESKCHQNKIELYPLLTEAEKNRLFPVQPVTIITTTTKPTTTTTNTAKPTSTTTTITTAKPTPPTTSTEQNKMEASLEKRQFDDLLVDRPDLLKKTCEECTKSKSKCSGPKGGICENCAKRHTECVFRTKRKPGPEPSTVKRSSSSGSSRKQLKKSGNDEEDDIDDMTKNHDVEQ